MNFLDERGRILIVEDMEFVRHALQAFLSEAGYAVEAVASGAAALARLKTGAIDLVLTDHRMPGMTGAELVVALKTRWPKLPVVMFTATAPREPVPGLDLLLHKPGDFRLIVPAIEKLLGRRSG